MCKVNIKKSILEIVERNNLEILKIDLYNTEESFVRLYGGEIDFSCKVYTTLEDLDFEVDSFSMQEEVNGTIYCRDKDTKEPVWIVSYGDEGGSWWEVNRVPDFYKSKNKKQESKKKAIKYINNSLKVLRDMNWFISPLRYEAMIYLDQAIKELKD